MPTTNKTTSPPQPHIALLPCVGMGHLLPLLRIASMLASRNCTITLITAHPTVSAAESDHLSTFFAMHPHINRLDFHLPPHKKSSNFTNDDPFFIHLESLVHSVGNNCLHPLLSSLSPPLSGIVADFPVTNSISKVAADLSLPLYVVITTSARFFTLMTYLPTLLVQEGYLSNECVQVPGLGPFPVSNIPPPMLNHDHYFSANICSNVSALGKVNGILINTFSSFESEAIEALRSNIGVPPILPVGPLESFEIGNAAHNVPWLDKQMPESVVFVSFGSRTALSKDQIRELGNGLEKSGCKFLWILKTSKVDKDDKEEVDEVLGDSFVERTKMQGVVVKGWVNQEQILAHQAIGGFVSHCGWNSVSEAARLGVPILAWPQHGDQKVNAEVVEKAGLGLRVGEWGWGGEKVVEANVIADKIKELMLGDKMRAGAKDVKEKARQAREISGTSEMLLRGLIDSFKSNEEK